MRVSAMKEEQNCKKERNKNEENLNSESSGCIEKSKIKFESKKKKTYIEQVVDKVERKNNISVKQHV